MQLFDADDIATVTARPSVRVDGVEIPETRIAREIQNHPAPSPEAAREAAARSLIVRELLLRRARELGIVAEPQSLGNGMRETDDDALVRGLLEQEVRVPAPTDEECRRYYDLHRSKFSSPDIFEASHILFSAAPSDNAAYAGAVEAARAAIEELRAAPGRFEALAAALSACPSAEQGGNLGQISRGQTAPEFEAALQHLGPGEIASEPVKTRYGAHVVRLSRRVSGCALPYEAVRERIADYLSDAVFHRAVHQYVALLAGSAEIEGIELTQAVTPLVQ